MADNNFENSPEFAQALQAFTQRRAREAASVQCANCVHMLPGKETMDFCGAPLPDWVNIGNDPLTRRQSRRQDRHVLRLCGAFDRRAGPGEE